MTLCAAAVLCLVLIIQLQDVKSLQTVEELVCKDMEAGSRILHPEFCNVYIMCTENGAMQISCQSRILFNPETEKCDADYQICIGGQVRDDDGSVLNYEEALDAESETEEYENAESVTEESEDATTTDQSELSPTEEIVITTTITTTVELTTQVSLPNHVACPKNDSDKLIIIGHETKCSVYYICYHGKPVPMECSMGLYWSDKNYKCVPKELSECQARSANPYPKCPPVGIDFLPHHEDCRWFWFCRHGFRMLQQCDAFYRWDINERKCKRKGESFCYKDVLKSMIAS